MFCQEIHNNGNEMRQKEWSNHRYIDCQKHNNCRGLPEPFSLFFCQDSISHTARQKVAKNVRNLLN